MKSLHLIIVLNIALSNQQILQRVENALTLLCRCTNCVLLHYRDCRSGEVKSVYVSSVRSRVVRRNLSPSRGTSCHFLSCADLHGETGTPTHTK